MSHISPEGKENSEAKVEIYADLIKVRKLTGKQTGGGKRGRVSTFSKASRKRFLEKLAKVRSPMEGAFFITLTYPGEWNPDPRTWKRDLDTFNKRAVRAIPGIGGFWRLEFQSRGAPHYHLLVFNVGWNKFALRQWVRNAWYEVVDSGDERHLKAGTQVDIIHNRRHAFAYAAKYAAKVHDDLIPRYLDQETGELVGPGRYWGTFGDVDISMAMEITISDDDLVNLRRLVAKLLKSRGSKYARRLKRGGIAPRPNTKRKTPVGFSAFGVGDLSRDWDSIFDSTAFTLVMAATG